MHACTTGNSQILNSTTSSMIIGGKTRVESSSAKKTRTKRNETNERTNERRRPVSLYSITQVVRRALHRHMDRGRRGWRRWWWWWSCSFSVAAAAVVVRVEEATAALLWGTEGRSPFSSFFFCCCCSSCCWRRHTHAVQTKGASRPMQGPWPSLLFAAKVASKRPNLRGETHTIGWQVKGNNGRPCTPCCVVGVVVGVVVGGGGAVVEEHLTPTPGTEGSTSTN
jgi:hypothetical protein